MNYTISYIKIAHTPYLLHSMHVHYILLLLYMNLLVPVLLLPQFCNASTDTVSLAVMTPICFCGGGKGEHTPVLKLLLSTDIICNLISGQS